LAISAILFEESPVAVLCEIPRVGARMYIFCRSLNNGLRFRRRTINNLE
jgi:hypothetical protein